MKKQQKTFKKKCKTGKKAPGKRATPTLQQNDRFFWNDSDIVITSDPVPDVTAPQ